MQKPLRFLIPALACLLGACAQPVKPVTDSNLQPTRTGTSPVAPVAMATPVATAAPALSADKEESFVAEASQRSGMSPAEVRAWLGEAQYQQSIINAITRPAEGKPWKDYRPIFLTDERIEGGRKFLAEHRAELDSVSRDTGVPPQYIVAIIGVETFYGRNTGNYRVLDALYTLGFFYPRREEFFRSELAQLFALSREEKMNLATLKGSYAGAMGWGQFMPSSYREFGRDGDGDGRRDLIASPRDAFASIANYFVGHGWQAGQPVFVPASAAPDAIPFVPGDFEAKYSLAELAAKGYRPAVTDAPDLPATLLTLEGENGPEYWIGYKNFYVITRYNRSPMYAMAVNQLAQAIAASPAPSP